MSDKKNIQQQIDSIQNLWRPILMSYGVLGFIANPIPAVLIMLASFYHPVVGLMGLCGNIISTITAMWVGGSRDILRAGIFGVSGLLVGLGLGMYSEPTIRLVVFLVIGSAAVGVISVLLGVKFAKSDLPILSMPFMLVIYPILLTVGVSKGDQNYFSRIPFLRDWNTLLFDMLPLELFQFVKMYGNILFQENLISGMLVFAAIGLFSRISLLYSFWGGILGLLTYHFLHGTLDGFHGLNFVLTALAFGGYFVLHNKHNFILVSLAIMMVGVLDLAFSQILYVLSYGLNNSLPTLVFAFNIVVLTILYPLKMTPFTYEGKKLLPVPLNVIKKPESNLRWAKRWMSRKYYQRTLLTFPIMGRWTILQGNDGEWTHKKDGRFAWDFVIMNEQGKQHDGLGLDTADFYCFGLPVLAPASGTIYAVVNNIEDNPPRSANTERNWGNYVVIDHGNGEYSEISHFKQGSIIVVPGQTVERGQLLGNCGNSGRSPVPHIHFQLQEKPKPGSKSLPAVFSEGIVNDVIKVNVNPKKNDLVEQLDIDSEANWNLLGKETETWEYECSLGVFGCSERLFFTTDMYGMPIVVSKNHYTWYILDKPSFVEIVPDFKTFPSFLSPSGFMKIVGESLILPKKLTHGLVFEKGKVSRLDDRLWLVTTDDREVKIDSELEKIIEVKLKDEPKFRFKLID